MTITGTFSIALALTLSPALAFALSLAIFLRTTIRADTIILFQTRSLAGGAFLLGLRRATVTLAIAVAALCRPVLCKCRNGCAAHHQSGHHYCG